MLKEAGLRVGQGVQIGDGDLFGCSVTTRGVAPSMKRVVVSGTLEEASNQNSHGCVWNFGSTVSLLNPEVSPSLQKMWPVSEFLDVR